MVKSSIYPSAAMYRLLSQVLRDQVVFDHSKVFVAQVRYRTSIPVREVDKNTRQEVKETRRHRYRRGTAGFVCDPAVHAR